MLSKKSEVPTGPKAFEKSTENQNFSLEVFLFRATPLLISLVSLSTEPYLLVLMFNFCGWSFTRKIKRCAPLRPPSGVPTKDPFINTLSNILNFQWVSGQLVILESKKINMLIFSFLLRWSLVLSPKPLPKLVTPSITNRDISFLTPISTVTLLQFLRRNWSNPEL